MTGENKRGLWHHIVAGARDIIVISTVLALLSGVAVSLTRPFWEPFSRLPEELQLLRENVITLQGAVTRGLKPQIVDFEGKAQIINPRTYKPGDTITLLYFLKRNAGCETIVHQRFFNVESGITMSGATIQAQQAPITEEYISFRVTVTLPSVMPAGGYIYAPRINPIECGVYGPMVVIPSEIFYVE